MLFGLAHIATRGMTGLQFCCAVMTGCLYGWVRIRYSSTVAAALTHGMYNLALYLSCGAVSLPPKTAATPVFGLKTEPGYRYHMAMATQHATRAQAVWAGPHGAGSCRRIQIASRSINRSISAHRESVSQSRPKEEIA